MSNAAADLYAAARVAVPLPDLWASYGWPTKVRGQRVVSSVSPCCGESTRDDALSMQLEAGGVWRWKCFRCNAGGTAVDAEAQKLGITSFQAARRLVTAAGGFVAIQGKDATRTPRKPKDGSPEQREAVAKAVGALRANRTFDPKVRAYLKGRGITERTIATAFGNGVLRSIPAHPAAAQTWWNFAMTDAEQLAAGVLKAGAKLPASCYRPLVFMPQDEGAEFRSIGDAAGAKALQLGHPKRPLVWLPDGDPLGVTVVEGGIDMLSVVDLGMRSTLVIGLFGTASWRPDWIVEFRDAIPAGTRWYVATDADKAGEMAANTILAQLAEAGVSAERKRPWGGKDWNDVLVAARKAF